MTGQRDHRGHRQGDALVGGAEHGVEPVGPAGVERPGGVRLAELEQAGAVLDQAGVDEGGGCPSALERELAEPERAGVDEEIDESSLPVLPCGAAAAAPGRFVTPCVVRPGCRP